LPHCRPKFMDFCVTHFTSSVLTSARTILGSPAYMAPEQIASGQASARTDLFALAVMAYEMLAGRKPFEAEAIATIIFQIVNHEPPRLTSLQPSLPARYDEVFRRALAKDPSVRFSSATAFVAALGRRNRDTAIAGGSTGALSTGPAAETQDLGTAAGARRSWPLGQESLRTWPAMVFAALVAAGGALMLRDQLPLGASAALEVASDPLGAEVTVDGVERGRSPLTLAGITAGPHIVGVRLAGYSSAELRVALPAGRNPVPLRFELTPVAVLLLVRSDPSGATVEVDGRPAGLTPLEELSLPAGLHRVEVKREGYRAWSQDLEAKAGEVVPVLARLQAAGGSTAADLRGLGWVRQGDVVSAKPGVTPPRRLSGEPAPYPKQARAVAIQGVVTVELTINLRGEPEDVKVVESAGDVLDRAVVAAVRTWRYAPAEKNGVKVRMRIQERQRFEGGR